MSEPTFWEPEDFVPESQQKARGSRRYVATFNNYNQSDYDALCNYERPTYIVLGHEIGGDKGTPHLQIYMEFENALLGKAIQKDLGRRFWIQPAKGAPKKAAGYCKKGRDRPPKNHGYEFFYPRTMETPDKPSNCGFPWERPFERGTISQQGKRTDVSQPCEAIVGEKATLKQIAREFPDQFVKYHKGFTALRSHVLQPRMLSVMPDVIVRWGPTGCGKSESARLVDWPDLDHYVWDPASKHWFDGYDGEDKIIIEEFRSHIPFRELLTLLDRYECKREYKGGMINITASKFIITSPTHPSTWYENLALKEGSINQLTRRITQVIEHRPRSDIRSFL